VSQAQSYDYQVYYWRDRDLEVDFVLVRRGKIVALEVKSGRRTMNEGLPAFTAQFHPHKALVIGSGGLSLEDFFTLNLELLFR
jgi:penicillin-binding protein-related factor A (putative recombinase)